MSIVPISQEIGSIDRPRRQETTLGGANAQTRFETTIKCPVIHLSQQVIQLEVGRTGWNKVLALEEAKTTQDKVIIRLKLIVKRLEKKRKARTSQPMKRRLFKGRLETSTEKYLKEKGSGEKGGSTANQTLITMRSEKEKEKGVAFRDVEEPPRLTGSTTTLQPLLTIDRKDKGKGVLVEEEPENLQKVKRIDQGLAQIESDTDLAQRIYVEELAELERAQKERQKKEEATIASLTEEFDEIQARIDADHELAVRMTHEEQEIYTIKERARLLAEYFKRRKKQLAAERAEAIRNKPPTRTQVRNMMITYLKHMEKRYHLIKEMLEKMLNWKIKAKAESIMAFDLLKFIKLQIEE
uniref:Uncharacterized protein n=1 Tax=Tanacetum cinerariifolium TaxID=118510 RepID=A0A6L2JF11_TANCI|nr:hypothetical protein [Tanacetum cinerariifolium]